MKIFNPKEHQECDCFLTTPTTGFVLTLIGENQTYSYDNFTLNRLIYVQRGYVEISCKDGTIVLLHEKEFVFVPIGREFSFKAHQDAVLITLNTLHIDYLCMRVSIPSLKKVQGTAYNGQYERMVYPANEAIERCFDSIEDYLNSGFCCKEMHMVKQREVFFLLRVCLSPEDLLSLFRPLFDTQSNFKATVLRLSQQVHNVCQLAQMMGLERAYFQRLFKSHFNTTPYQWMLQQKEEKTRHLLRNTEQPIKVVATKLGFASVSHLNDFCHKKFGKTAHQIREGALPDIVKGTEKAR